MIAPAADPTVSHLCDTAAELIWLFWRGLDVVRVQ
jgi:hypothetical protein